MLSDADTTMLRQNQCPRCLNWGFIEGPRGGAGQNIFCANPACKAAYMIAPRNDIVMAELMGIAPENYYPPLIHIIDNSGFPLCNFAGSMTIHNGPPPHTIATSPDAWPIGHDYVQRNDFERATCIVCRGRLQPLS